MSDSAIEISELNRPEINILNSEVELGRRIFGFYLDCEWDGTIPALDQILDLWLLDERERKPSSNELCSGLGSLVGEYLRLNHKCRWVVVSDAFGCDLGMNCDTTGCQVFPRHWIAKRLDAENIRHGVINGIVDTLIREGKLAP
jgi:hypothetical protein